MFPIIHGISSALGDAITFLFRDDFLTDEAAPMVTPRVAEPGPGTLTINDGDNIASINDGDLIVNGVTTGAVGISNSVSARSPGLVCYIQSRRHVGILWNRNGWSTTGAMDVGNMEFVFWWGTGTELRASVGNTHLPRLHTASSNTEDTDIFISLRSSGCFAVVNGKLVWVDDAENTASLYAQMGVAQAVAGGVDMSWGTLRVSQLPAPWNTDYGIATDRHAGSVDAGQTFTHEADCLIEFTATTVPSADNIDVFFRAQDSSNYWIARITSGGALDLIEVVAGTPTSRGSGGTVTGGDRIVIICDDETITGYVDNAYVDNVQAWSYSSAANFKSETAGELDSLGTDGAISDLVTWPRTLSGAAKAALDAVANA